MSAKRALHNFGKSWPVSHGLSFGLSYSLGLQTSFSLKDLFSNGEAGALYTPWDLSTMYQDAAGTTPAAIDSPVGLRMDQSGNGNHATQPTASARPILREDANGSRYLEYDGVDDCFIIFDSSTSTVWDHFSDAIMLAVANNPSVITGDGSAWTSANSLFCHRSDTTVNTDYGVTICFGYDASELQAGFSENTSTDFEVTRTSGAISASTDYVQMAVIDGDSVALRSNGQEKVSETLTVAIDSRAANQDLRDVRIGCRTSNAGGPLDFYTGREYGLIYRDAVPTSAEIKNIESELAKRAGVTL